MSGKSSSSPAVEEWVSRLYIKPNKQEKKTKHVPTVNDALISALPSDTLKWMRQRRTPMYTGKVAISIFQERQLREIFNGLDLENNGVINLAQLQEAARYVENSTKDSVTPLKNVYELFANMDDDGNGEVDFHEFTQAMIISKARSEIEVQRMHQKFIEFSFTKKREYSLKCIEEIRKKVEAELEDDSNKNKKDQREGDFDVVQAGVQAYRLFKNLFQGNQFLEETDDGSKVTKTKTNTLSSSNIDIDIIENRNRKLKKYIQYIDHLNGYDNNQSNSSTNGNEIKTDDDDANIPKFRRRSNFQDVTISDLTISNIDATNTNTNTNSDIAVTNTKTVSSNNTIDTKETRYRELRERMIKVKKDEIIGLEKDPDGRHKIKRLEEEKLFDVELNKLITPKATLDSVKCKVGKLVLPKETLVPVENTVKSKMKNKMAAGKLSQELLPIPIIEKTYLRPVGNLKETITTTTMNSLKVHYSPPSLKRVETFPIAAQDGSYHLSNAITWKDKKIPYSIKKKLEEQMKHVF